MKKNICVLFGTLCFMLVFGLAMNFTNCENSQKAEIRVTNSSPIAADDVITVDVLMEGRSTPVDTKEVSKNKSVTFSLDTGEYRVRVTTSTYNTYSYP
ncbi:MAG: hypothetical protein FWH41_07590, partial [Treponema sp.]|nr:hypothetical protein [Treponema sp.]